VLCSARFRWSVGCYSIIVFTVQWDCIGTVFLTFLLLFSSGLWDVMSNQEAVDMVAEIMESYDSTDNVSWNNGGAFQEAAEHLAIEAYVRGSTDNIGVCVVAVDK
jgi:serine/threonine protein phosphatase PrpC